MPVKIARSTPRPSFGLPEPLVGIHTSRQSCCKAAKARVSRQFGVIRGIPVGILFAAISGSLLSDIAASEPLVIRPPRSARLVMAITSPRTRSCERPLTVVSI